MRVRSWGLALWCGLVAAGCGAGAPPSGGNAGPGESPTALDPVAPPAPEPAPLPDVRPAQDEPPAPAPLDTPPSPPTGPVRYEMGPCPSGSGCRIDGARLRLGRGGAAVATVTRTIVTPDPYPGSFPIETGTVHPSYWDGHRWTPLALPDEAYVDSLGVMDDGTLVAAGYSSAGRELVLHTWKGTGWTRQAWELPASASQDYFLYCLRATPGAGGRVAITWLIHTREYPWGRRWTALWDLASGHWELLGEGIVSAPERQMDGCAEVALTRSGEPVLAWNEPPRDGAPDAPDLHRVMRWSARTRAWESLGTPSALLPDDARLRGGFRLALDGSDAPALAGVYEAPSQPRTLRVLVAGGAAGDWRLLGGPRELGTEGEGWAAGAAFDKWGRLSVCAERRLASWPWPVLMECQRWEGGVWTVPWGAPAHLWPHAEYINTTGLAFSEDGGLVLLDYLDGVTSQTLVR